MRYTKTRQEVISILADSLTKKYSQIELDMGKIGEILLWCDNDVRDRYIAAFNKRFPAFGSYGYNAFFVCDLTGNTVAFLPARLALDMAANNPYTLRKF